MPNAPTHKNREGYSNCNECARNWSIDSPVEGFRPHLIVKCSARRRGVFVRFLEEQSDAN